jgi:prolyl-tRNA synthetase
MTHSDDDGFVAPPKVAPIQVAILPIWRNEED